jgi:PRC-barrel domain
LTILNRKEIPIMESQTHAHTPLIASDRVEGTVVYNREGERLGTIKHFMVDKRSGQVEHAILGFGGLFGMGASNYPLPWDVLDYDPERGGYVVDLDKDMLQNAPKYDETPPAYDEDYNRSVRTYYNAPLI